MRKIIWIMAVLIVGITVPFFNGIIKENNFNDRETNPMKIESSAFEHNESIPKKYTCDGENINPPLSVSEVPKRTKSIVLIVDDPDAPVGLWVHWVVWNISPQTKEIKENTVPGGATEGITSFGKPGYGGPCPPDGEHRYFFKIYALDTDIELPRDADKETLEEAIIGHVLDKAELVGLYDRR